MNELSSIEQDLPVELKGVWGDLSAELGAKGFQKHLDSLEQSIQSTRQLASMLQTQFQGMAPESIDQNARIAARKALVSSLQAHSLTINSLESVFSSISAKAKGLVQKVLDWIVQNIVEVLSNFSGQLNLKEWSVEVTGGLPLGVTFSVTVTFK